LRDPQLEQMMMPWFASTCAAGRSIVTPHQQSMEYTLVSRAGFTGGNDQQGAA
jgi:hypothetical protein